MYFAVTRFSESLEFKQLCRAEKAGYKNVGVGRFVDILYGESYNENGKRYSSMHGSVDVGYFDK